MIDRPDTPGLPAPSQGVYGITVAAELSGVAVQSLRLYERDGLLSPARSDGGTRLYSADDLARLQRISELVAAGINLAGSPASLTCKTTTKRCSRPIGPSAARRLGKPSPKGCPTRM